MQFLHGAIGAGQKLWLWAETPRNDSERSDHSWPFALPEQPLRELLRQVFRLREVSIRDVDFTLPVTRGKAIPSNPVIEEYPAATEFNLKRFSIASAMVSAETVLKRLANLEKTVIEPGVFCAPDLLYCAEVARFGLYLVTTQKYIPSVQDRRPVWQPILLGEDRRRFEQLANAMPGACRAITTESTENTEKKLERFLQEIISSMQTCTPRQTNLLHDRWLCGLVEGDELTGFHDETIREFQEALVRWTAPLARRTSFEYRVAFRLEEPTAKRNFWYLRYFLQSENDPSLLVPLDKIWKYTKSARHIFGDRYELAIQNALASLAQAAKIDPFIENSLRQPHPSGYQTNEEEAWNFLNSRAWILRDSGFGVLLPSWWGKQNFRLGLKARAKGKQSFSAADGNPLIDFDWKLAIGSEEIPYQEFIALAKLKKPLVKFRGKWIELRPEQIEAAVSFWKTKSESVSFSDLLRLITGAEQAGGLPVVEVEASGWLSEFLHDFHEHARYQLLTVPQQLHGTLRDYQHRGFSWLHFMKTYRLGACLADDMGLGKTVQTITLLLSDRDAGRPVLLICPTSVVGNWQRELERFSPSLNVMIHHGVKRKKGFEFENSIRDCDVVLSSYSLLLRDIETFRSIQWRGVVLDEAQNIKNAETKQARAARSIQADYRIALTGTPVENNVGELWSIFEFLNPGLLGSKAQFKQRYFQPIHTNNDPVAAEELRRATGPFLLRRLKTDADIIRDLPKKMEMKVFCNLTREQASLYEAVVRSLEEDLKDEEAGGIQRKGKVLAALGKLKQICNHPAHFLKDGSPLLNRSGKLSRLTEMLEEAMQSDDRVLIFTQFVEMGQMLKSHLQNYFGREVAFLHGAVPRNTREKIVERFNQDPDGPPIFLLSLKAGGTGLNLTRANHVFHFDRWWNPAVEEQATDRAYRIGQTKNVQVHKLICIGTLEERIDAMIERKKSISGNVIGTGEAWLTELSTSELKALIALGKEAVSV